MTTRKTQAEILVENIVMTARPMRVNAAVQLIPIPGGSNQIMITTQEEDDGSVSWWIRIVTPNWEPLRSWHAVGRFGLMNAAVECSMAIFPKGFSL